MLHIYPHRTTDTPRGPQPRPGRLEACEHLGTLSSTVGSWCVAERGTQRWTFPLGSAPHRDPLTRSLFCFLRPAPVELVSAATTPTDTHSRTAHSAPDKQL